MATPTDHADLADGNHPAMGEVIDRLDRAAILSRRDPLRRGNVVELPEKDDVVILGDIHGDRENFERVIEWAALHLHKKRYLVIQELIHGGPQDEDGGDLSFRLLEDAAALLEQALSINPNYTEAALNLAVTYNDLGRYEEARVVYSRAVAISKSAPKRLDPYAKGKLANMHADLGSAYHGLGMYDEAIEEYSKALRMAPDFVDIRTKLGNTYRDKGDLDRAERELRRAMTQKPNYIPARIHLGFTLYRQGRVPEAVTELQEALKLDPDNKRCKLYLEMLKSL